VRLGRNCEGKEKGRNKQQERERRGSERKCGGKE
jgi:hypothetical protein